MKRKIPKYILAILILDFLLIAADHLILLSINSFDSRRNSKPCLLSTVEQKHIIAPITEVAEGYTVPEEMSDETGKDKP